MLKSLEKSKHFKRLCFKYTDLRYLNTPSVEKTKRQDLLARRFGRKAPIPKSTNINSNFVYDLFNGAVDKEIFQFPSVVQKEELNSLLRHSVEIEDYLKTSVDLNNGINSDVIKGLQKVEAFGLTIPTKYNGLGYSLTESIFLLECGAVNWKVGQFIRNNENLGIHILTKYGTEEQKQKYLPKLATGEILATVAFLENGPLMDSSVFEGNALFDYQKQQFLINAQKKWVSHADVADIILVLTKTVKFQSMEDFKSKFNMFIVEKDTPGLSIQQLNSERVKDYGLFEVNFKNVKITEGNVIGGNDINGYTILQSVLTCGELGVAALCSSMLKKLIYLISNFCSEKNLLNHSVKQYEHVQSNVASITAYAYGLESSLYFVAGRMDLCEEGNFLCESIITKIFAIKALSIGIEKFVQTVGPESIKSSGILDEAWKVLQYCTIFDENCLLLKLLLGMEGIVYKGRSSSKLIKQLRKPDQYPKESLKFFLQKAFHKKHIQNLKMELHNSLSDTADGLENCIMYLEKVVKDMLVNYGNLLPEQETLLTLLADFVTYVYVLTASITRASNAYCNDEEGSADAINIARFLGTLIEVELNHIKEMLAKEKVISFYHREIGKMTFSQKQYPAAHPLIRTY